MSGKYILRIAEEGYLVQKNISFAFLKCIGVNVELCKSEREYPETKQKHKVVEKSFFILICIAITIYNVFVFLFDVQSSGKALMFLDDKSFFSLRYFQNMYRWHLIR